MDRDPERTFANLHFRPSKLFAHDLVARKERRRQLRKFDVFNAKLFEPIQFGSQRSKPVTQSDARLSFPIGRREVHPKI